MTDPQTQRRREVPSAKTTTPPDEQHEVLNAEEVGKILRIHPVTVRLKAAAGIIPGRQLGNRWRFSRTRINEWLMAA